MDFNPRFPRGKRPSAGLLQSMPRGFQSTLPAREATLTLMGLPDDRRISIHASREGSDFITRPSKGCTFDFNPRFPRGKRLLISPFIPLILIISIHASREGSDHRHRCRSHHGRISIHASREGSDRLHKRAYSALDYFNPRFPRGKRPPMEQTRFSDYAFQSTLPAREATSNSASVIFL